MDQPAYYIDCFRKSDGTPDLDNGNPAYRPWFVARRLDGAWMAQCKTRASAEKALAKCLAKLAAAL